MCLSPRSKDADRHFVRIFCAEFIIIILIAIIAIGGKVVDISGTGIVSSFCGIRGRAEENMESFCDERRASNKCYSSHANISQSTIRIASVADRAHVTRTLRFHLLCASMASISSISFGDIFQVNTFAFMERRPACVRTP